MAISKDEVLYVAQLAKLDIKSEDMDKLVSQIGDVLSYVEKLSEADTENVDPTSQSLNLVNRLRDDTLDKSLGRKTSVENSKDSYDGMFVVPKIVKD